MAMIAEGVVECSYLSLDMDTSHPVEVKESSYMICSCTGPVKLTGARVRGSIMDVPQGSASVSL